MHMDMNYDKYDFVKLALWDLPFKRSTLQTHRFHQHVSLAHSSRKKWQHKEQLHLNHPWILKQLKNLWAQVYFLNQGGKWRGKKNYCNQFWGLMERLMGMIWFFAEKESALFEWWIPSIFKTRKNAFDRRMFSPALLIFPYLESYIFPWVQWR